MHCSMHMRGPRERSGREQAAGVVLRLLLLIGGGGDH